MSLRGNARRRILIDGRMAANVGGGFTHLVNVIPRLVRMAPEDDFLLLTRTQRAADSIPSAPNLELRLLPEMGPAGRIAFTFLKAPQIVREWGADLYFSVSEYAPVGLPCPTIASFRNPNVFTSLQQDWPATQKLRLATLRALAKASALFCDRIMFVSQDSADWAGDAISLPRQKRAVVHHGIDLSKWTDPAGPSPHPRPYILSVSTIYRYKNFVRLIEGYAELARRNPAAPDLVIAGNNADPDYEREMQAARLATGEVAERIRIVGEVPYGQIRDYYANAELFVFPSYLETFGHPLLESMASGVPIVAADTGVFREICGDAAAYVDPYSTSAFADAMEEVLFGFDASRSLAKRGRRRVEEFTWDQSTRRLLRLFDELTGLDYGMAAAPRPIDPVAAQAEAPSALAA